MVDLGDAQPLDRLDAIGEGVEAGAEDDDLPHAARDRAPRRVFGEAAAHGDVEAQAAQGRIGARLGDRGVRVRPENAQGQRVVEHAPAVDDLMRGATAGGAERGAAELSLSHGARLSRAARRRRMGASSWLAGRTFARPRPRRRAAVKVRVSARAAA